jgi:hypothetical protein
MWRKLMGQALATLAEFSPTLIPQLTHTKFHRVTRVGFGKVFYN